MAKRKRRSNQGKQSSDSAVVQQGDQQIDSSSVSVAPAPEDVAMRFVGQWNRLVSTTNWEKGRIICGWREALLTSGAAITEYSDEAWAQIVGGVTSQHIGRLRRVYQRFGELYDQFEGLYWSHFQAALDWSDAEMWLEGALQQEWSVSQMRGKRWETLGTPEEQRTSEAELAAAEIEFAEGDPIEGAAADQESEGTVQSEPLSSSTKEILPAEIGDQSAEHPAEASADPASAGPQTTTPKRQRLNVRVEDLPDDLADAFEQFKLAIIAHRHEAWSETTPEIVVQCLDALRELALAPAD